MNIKFTVYVQAVKFTFDKEFTVTACTYKQKTDRQMTVIDICEHEFEIDVPEMDKKKLTLLEVEQLQAMKKQIMSDMQIKLQSVDDKINSLLALESK